MWLGPWLGQEQKHFVFMAYLTLIFNIIAISLKVQFFSRNFRQTHVASPKSIEFN